MKIEMSVTQFDVKVLLRALVIAASTWFLAACGGGSGSGDDSPGNVDSLVPLTGSTTSADELTTRQIQEIAATSMNNMLSLGSGSASSEMTSLFDPNMDSIMEGDSTETNFVSENVTSTDLNTSLGLNSNEVESISREGNVVTIDLNENEICTPQSSGGDSLRPDASSSDDIDQEACRSLLQYASVEINAISDDSGVVSYLYRGEPIFRAGYAPNAGSYEVRLDPLLTIAIDQQAYLSEPGEQLLLPESFSGAIRISAEADADSPDELGKLSLELTEALNISVAVENLSITAQPSTVLAISVTPTDGSIEFDITDFQIDALSDSETDQAVSFNVPGFSGRADIRESDGLLIVSNFGMSNGPITISIGSGDSIQLMLEKFGFTVSEADDEIVLTGDLNLNVLLDNTFGMLVEESSIISLALESLAPSGSAFSSSGSGPVQLLRGGPFSVSYSATDGETTEGSSVNVDAGGCFDSPGDDSDAGSLIELVACEN